MLIALGFIIVFASIFGGYVFSGGSMGPLLQPFEFLMIGGAAIGAFVAANNFKTIKSTLLALPKLKRTNKYDKAMYLDVLALLFALLSKARRDGMLGIERDIENPEDSDLFKAYPKVLGDPMVMQFVVDYLRLMISGNTDPHELNELMLHEIEGFEHHASLPVDALNKVSDALPAFGIVAAVMGVVKALTMADAGPDIMGQMIAHALVGTFLGILFAYGLVAPFASRIDRQVGEANKMLQCLRVTLLASLNGSAPSLAVEFGRKALHGNDRPSNAELEDYVRGNRSAEAADA